MKSKIIENPFCEKCGWLKQECHCGIKNCDGPCCNDNHPYWEEDDE